MRMILAVSMLALAAGCTDGGSAGGGGITKEECKAFMVKGFELRGMPEDIYRDTIDATAQLCADKDAVSREDYDCVMRAGSVTEMEACNAVVDYS